MNSITVVGRLTADPELKNVNGYACLSFSIAERSVSKNADGEYMTNFFDVTAWRSLAERASAWFRKGDKVCVSGPVTIRHYVKKDKTDGVSVQIRADNIEGMMPRRDNANSASNGQAYSNAAPQCAAASSPQSNGFTQVANDDLPF